MTWMASLNNDAGLASLGTPPFSRRMAAINTGDCPNFFSNFIWDRSDAFSVFDSDIAEQSQWRRTLQNNNNTTRKVKRWSCK